MDNNVSRCALKSERGSHRAPFRNTPVHPIPDRAGTNHHPGKKIKTTCPELLQAVCHTFYISLQLHKLLKLNVLGRLQTLGAVRQI